MDAHRAPDFRALSIAERLQLVEEIWDSIAADADAESFPLTDAERVLLDVRLAEHIAHPDSGSPWAEVRARLLDKKR